MKAIILAGGSGTRLWPVSRYGLPKQFMKLEGDKSLLARTIERLLQVCSAKDIYVITNDDYKFHVKEDLKSVSKDLEDNIILEPAGRNTAPAIALTVKYCLEKLKCRRDETILICPSDHIIKPVEKFAQYARQAEEVAKKGFIVTFGVIPDRPETGYGYIKRGAKLVTGHKSQVTGKESAYGEVYRVARFAEKPDQETAGKYLKDGGYYWNSGMFAFTPTVMLAELKKYAPDICRRLRKNLAGLTADFASMPNISIDYAVMEKSSRAAVLPLKLTWSDIGSWDSLPEITEADAKGNVRIGDVLDIDTRNSIIVGGGRLISTVGVKDLIVVDTEDALLIIKRGEAQRVKDVVGLLKGSKRKEVMEHTTAYRPWGSYTILEEGPRYKIKRIMVKPQQKLSRQLHHHRSEHWIVVKGMAKVSIGSNDSFVHENESTYVPKSTLHRLENPGKVPLEVIEVQNGEYVEEDDIIRVDDVYGRGGKK
ncbi:MAG: mannose-1-phosphate guanylyltransferase/mannose-6-phosphate isomerase [Elusimicrobia bacterium GWA2_56_46]|nr:MAG: mannose-1-phosphate guanylyltransferase/mannose-6-phosphate isomerase [Elusimicrobia bacterium GWA2_56_46]OGR53695.1 MAG: mannose-1-phosphate guanylyltransferase/mannose-6-phosphate isomerase [Elusimicrobia bacterium GWC2_56_31]HBW23166.1 mannose-1-phosphate guanylyltransferase/mannose-6-phosphate isomerase [Elusimicrobiota bacterium]